MSAFTEPSRVPIHSPITGTSIWTTGTTVTSTGGGGGACLRAHADGSRTAGRVKARSRTAETRRRREVDGKLRMVRSPGRGMAAIPERRSAHEGDGRLVHEAGQLRDHLRRRLVD